MSETSTGTKNNTANVRKVPVENWRGSRSGRTLVMAAVIERVCNSECLLLQVLPKIESRFSMNPGQGRAPTRVSSGPRPSNETKRYELAVISKRHEHWRIGE
jgi:hypothetical protein